MQKMTAIKLLGLGALVLVGLYLVRGANSYDSVLREEEKKLIPEPSYKQKARMEQEASVLAKQTCAELVPGLRSVVKLDLSTYEDNPNKWRGTADVDFMNEIGGVSRTNVPLTFHVYGLDARKELSCFLDHEEILRRQRVVFDAQMEAIFQRSRR